jgi:hypothetical protein
MGSADSGNCSFHADALSHLSRRSARTLGVAGARSTARPLGAELVGHCHLEVANRIDMYGIARCGVKAPSNLALRTTLTHALRSSGVTILPHDPSGHSKKEPKRRVNNSDAIVTRAMSSCTVIGIQ